MEKFWSWKKEIFLVLCNKSTSTWNKKSWHTWIILDHQILKPFILFQAKSKILAKVLQPKDQCISYVDMVDAQAKAYEKALWEWHTYEEMKSKISTIDWFFQARSLRITNIFTHMKKLSNHPLLVRIMYPYEVVKKLAKKVHCL